jgi:DNA-binding Lrp family transcriptional regulator
VVPVTHAIVLIQAERTALAELGALLAEVPGVAEAYSVTGEWDFAAILRLREQDELAHVVTERLARLPGITKTQTLVAFEVYSKHDLEALFSVGE